MCANNIPRPKSAVDSQGPRQLLTTVVLPVVLVPAKKLQHFGTATTGRRDEWI
jgi:hypothetical protein